MKLKEIRIRNFLGTSMACFTFDANGQLRFEAEVPDFSLTGDSATAELLLREAIKWGLFGSSMPGPDRGEGVCTVEVDLGEYSIHRKIVGIAQGMSLRFL
jgi:hypothetical protein